MPCWKLVRDKIGEELEAKADGVNLIVYRASRDALDNLLRAKIVEEAAELASTGSIEEAADLLEALYSWLELKGVSLEAVEEIMARKRHEKGGFSKGYVVVWLDRETC